VCVPVPFRKAPGDGEPCTVKGAEAVKATMIPGARIIFSVVMIGLACIESANTDKVISRSDISPGGTRRVLYRTGTPRARIFEVRLRGTPECETTDDKKKRQNSNAVAK
jgi:hypothetical protein